MASTYHVEVALFPDVTVAAPGATFSLGVDGLTGPTQIEESDRSTATQSTTKCISIDKVNASFTVKAVFPTGSTDRSVSAPSPLTGTVSGQNGVVTVPASPSEAVHQVSFTYTPAATNAGPVEKSVTVTVRVRTGTTSVV